VGILGGVVGLIMARSASRATDPAEATRHARASVFANLGLGALQLVAFAVSLSMLSQLHH